MRKAVPNSNHNSNHESISRSVMGEGDIVEVTIIPETWIIAPLMSKEQLMRYAELGWISREDAEHLDRAFPRNAEGKPVIFKMWLEAPLKRAAVALGLDRRRVLDFHILDDKGFPVEYIVIPGKPLIYKRAILPPVGGKGKPSMEVYEYIDSTFRLKFRVRTKYFADFIKALGYAGNIGMMSRTRKGFGKFRVEADLSGSGKNQQRQ